MRKWYTLLAALLLLPALLIELDAMIFLDDEAIRALVAQEMRWSGDYLVPSLHADAYLNKPPLWNWILAASFTLCGGPGEWAARFPTVVSLLGFAATAFLLTRPYLGRYFALVHALTVITCSRMLFWDSMLALIDVCFSWVVFTQIVLLYRYGSQRRWWMAFGVSYLLTAVAFLLKGLPAVVFQGLTVFVLLGFLREWRQFFRPAHLLSGIGCLLLLALYYVPYAQRIDLLAVAERLFVESGKRTALARGWGETAGHLLTFPFEMAYHFLPWTLLGILGFRRGAGRVLRAHPFATFCLLACGVNLLVYWLSPNVYPRYLLMLFPLLFVPLLVWYRWQRKEGGKGYRIVRGFLLTVMALFTLALPLLPLFPLTPEVDYAWAKSLGLGAVAGAILVGAWRDRSNFLLLLGCFLLLLRIGFNWFVLPERATGNPNRLAVRDSADRTVSRLGGRDLAIYHHTLIEPATGYYLSVAYGGVVPRHFTDFGSRTAYVVAPQQYPDVTVRAIDSLYLRHLRSRHPVGPLRFPLPPPPADTLNLVDGMGTGIPLR